MRLPTKVLVWPDITETVFSAAFATYTSPLVESNVMPQGSKPTDIGLPTKVLVWPDITDTVLLLTLVTYTSPLAESKARYNGSPPTGIVAITGSALAIP